MEGDARHISGVEQLYLLLITEDVVRAANGVHAVGGSVPNCGADARMHHGSAGMWRSRFDGAFIARKQEARAVGFPERFGSGGDGRGLTGSEVKSASGLVRLCRRQPQVVPIGQLLAQPYADLLAVDPHRGTRAVHGHQCRLLARG